MLFGRFLRGLIVLATFQILSGVSIARAEGFLPLETKTPLKAVYHMIDKEEMRIRLQAVFLAGEADIQGPQGLSHYLEHLIYLSAAKKINTGFHGRSGNAWVNGFVTVYYQEGDHTELNSMFEFMQNLLAPPSLPEKFMLEERKIVQREYDLRVLESPDWKMWHRARALLYAENGAGRSVIGTRESIDKLTMEEGIGFHRKCYHPANMILMISGPLEKNTARALVERRFGHLAVGETCAQPWRDNFPASPLQGGPVEYSDRNVSREAFKLHGIARWTTGKGKRHDIYTLGFLRELLISALEGGLAKPLRIDAFFVSGFDVWLMNPVDGSLEIWFQGALDEGVSARQGIEAARKAFQSIAREGIPAKSIERIRKRLLKTANRNFDKVEYHRNRGNIMLSMGAMPDGAADHIRALESVTREDLQSAVQEIARFERFVEIVMRPEKLQ